MPQPSPFTGFLAALFPTCSPRLCALYESAADNGGLVKTDFYTLRDLLELSGYVNEEPVQTLLLSLLLALDEGSLCVEATEAGLSRRLEALLAPDEVSALAREASTALGRYPRLIGSQVTDGKPLILHQHADRPFLYFQKYLKHEQLLHTWLQQRLQEPAPAADPQALRTLLTAVLEQEPVQIAGQPVQLNRDQRLAVAVGLLRNFTIISGGPGTGKTSIVFTLLRCLVRSGVPVERIALAAPTGRAAQRLTDSLRSGLANLQERLPEASPDRQLDQLSAATLHHLLGYQPSRGTFRHHRENPLPADVVIVDEVSMVGLFLMAQLLQATAPQTRLILLGDKDQLPSVEAGAVLAHLVGGAERSGFSPQLGAALATLYPDLAPLPVGSGQPLQDVLVVLEQNYRSQQDILDVARAVNRQDEGIVERLHSMALPAVPAPQPARGRRRSVAVALPSVHEALAEVTARTGCWLLDQEQLDLPQWRQVLEAWLERHFLTGETESYRSLVETTVLPDGEAIPGELREPLDRLFAVLNRSRILTLVREGPYGCVSINQFLDQQLRLRLDRSARGSLFLGAPVLMTRNDYGRQLFNGDVGITLRSQSGVYRVVLPRQGGYVSFLAEALPAHELAFALTVHKSQGSEYGQVLLVLPSEGGRRLLTKEMIYTGITRAKQLVLICANKATLRQAIRRRVERESGLSG